MHVNILDNPQTQHLGAIFNDIKFDLHTSKHRKMAEMPSLLHRPVDDNSASSHRWSPRKRIDHSKSLGKRVQPGRVISRAERDRQASDPIHSLDGQDERATDTSHSYCDYEYSFKALGDKCRWAVTRRGSHLLNGAVLHDEADSAHTQPSSSSLGNPREREAVRPVQSLIVLIIAIILVFGSLYTLLEYLLAAVRVSAQCTPSTVYLPVTYTVTSAACASYLSTAFTTQTRTVTFTEVYTSSAQAMSTDPTALSASSTGLDPYMYTVDPSGATSWVNGISPPSGASRFTETTTVTIMPSLSSKVASTSTSFTTTTSTDTILQTITVPPSSTTILSCNGSTYTSTSTSTIYTTVGPTSTSATPSRMSFQGLGPGGWNSTTSNANSIAPSAMNTTQATAYTKLIYLTAGDPSTSTSTQYFTTTIDVFYVTSSRAESASTGYYDPTFTAGSTTSSQSLSGTVSASITSVMTSNPVSATTPSSLVEAGGQTSSSATSVASGTSYDPTLSSGTQSAVQSDANTSTDPSTVSLASSATMKYSAVLQYTTASTLASVSRTQTVDPSQSFSNVTTSASTTALATYFPGSTTLHLSSSMTASLMSSATTFALPSSIASSLSQSMKATTSQGDPVSSAGLPTSAPSSGCTRRGNSTLSFDDLPAKGNSNGTLRQEQLIPHLYSGLHFSYGFGYVPSTQTAFKPISNPNLAMFRPNVTTSLDNTTNSLLKPGEVNIGPRSARAGVRFDAYQAYLGCGSTGNQTCGVTVTGYTWNSANSSSNPMFAYNTTLTPCTAKHGCSLRKVVFPPQFRRLTGLQVQMHQANDTRKQYPFYMDNLVLSWSDASCESSTGGNASSHTI